MEAGSVLSPGSTVGEDRDLAASWYNDTGHQLRRATCPPPPAHKRCRSPGGRSNKAIPGCEGLDRQPGPRALGEAPKRLLPAAPAVTAVNPCLGGGLSGGRLNGRRCPAGDTASLLSTSRATRITYGTRNPRDHFAPLHGLKPGGRLIVDEERSPTLWHGGQLPKSARSGRAIRITTRTSCAHGGGFDQLFYHSNTKPPASSVYE